MKNLVVCIGELLIDFFCTDVDVNLSIGANFLKQAGGAPANVSATIAKLGGNAAFVGKVGSDQFGDFLENTLHQANVDTTMISRDKDVQTTLAFVSLQANGERDFVFYRGADERLKMDDINIERLLLSKIMHFGSATALIGGSSQETYIKLMDVAKENGKFISFDPNFRSNLWVGREEEFVNLALMGVSKADFVKVSEEELFLLTQEADVEKSINKLHSLGANLVAVTLGKEGAVVSNRNRLARVPSIQVHAIDSTGAGDAFVGAMLYKFAEKENPFEITQNFEELQLIVDFSNKVGAEVCTKVGAWDLD
jgi:fructokinase